MYSVPDIDFIHLEDNIYFLNGVIKISFIERDNYIELVCGYEFKDSDRFNLKQIVKNLFKKIDCLVLFTTNPFFKKLGFIFKNGYYYSKNPFTNNILEVCTGSYRDAFNVNLLADRIELNSALFLGGLTPTPASLSLVLANLNLEVVSMVRPRGAGFCYSKEEIEEIFLDARMMLDSGSHGIVFGFLDESRNVNADLTKQMIDLCNSYGALSIFHRAIDASSNYLENIDLLVNLGIDRILTSGAKSTIIEGLDTFLALKNKYSRSVEFVAASGINLDNILFLKDKGINVLHGTFKKSLLDVTTSSIDVDYSYNYKNSYETSSLEDVTSVKKLFLNEVDL